MLSKVDATIRRGPDYFGHREVFAAGARELAKLEDHPFILWLLRLATQ